MNTRRKQIVASLKDKEYRDAFVGSLIRVRLPAQIRELRRARGLSQAKLADTCQMQQSQISKYEQMGHDEFSLATLKRLASAFDVGLKVCFVPFSELVDQETAYPDTLSLDVPSFTDDHRLRAADGTRIVEFLYPSIRTETAGIESEVVFHDSADLSFKGERFSAQN